MKGFITSFLLRLELLNKVTNLEIEKCGIDSEGDPFVKLKEGPIFYGSRSSNKLDHILYPTLPRGVRMLLSKECIQVAVDIVIRYNEGGLKYGGPKKQSRYKVSRKDKVAEMGAYQGFCSIKLAEQVGEKGSVIAIEPMPDNFRLLEKNVKANNLSHVTCVNKGVWDVEKKLKFNRKKNDRQSSSIEIKYNNSDYFIVQADSLDNIFNDIDEFANEFMIIQLNGAEINALRGLSIFKPKHLSIAARYDTEGVDAALAISKLLKEKGYTVEVENEDFVFAELN